MLTSEWLVGRTLFEVERLDSCVWRFRFGPDAEVGSECPWRIIRDGGIALSSVDHGQQYVLLMPGLAWHLTRLPTGNQAAVLTATGRDSLTAVEVQSVVDLLRAASLEQEAYVLESPRADLQQ
ncbi:MAG TPA: hypothetical protein VGJ05_15980 [Fimbriiglobus sp.]|jgi:hypothetical protein